MPFFPLCGTWSMTTLGGKPLKELVRRREERKWLNTVGRQSESPPLPYWWGTRQLRKNPMLPLKCSHTGTLVKVVWRRHLMSKPPCCFQKQERDGKAFFSCIISAYTKKAQQTTKNLYCFLSKQHWGKYNYLKQAYGALQCVQKGLQGYPWFRIKLWQGKEILPLLLNTIHWHGFLIFWRSTSLHIRLQTYSIPAYEAWVQVSLNLAACASAHISIVRVVEGRTIRKRERNEYNLMALCSRAWSEKV